MPASTLCELMDRLWNDLNECDLDTVAGQRASHDLSLQIGELVAEHFSTGGFLTNDGLVIVHAPDSLPSGWKAGHPRIARWNRANAAMHRLAFVESFPAPSSPPS